MLVLCSWWQCCRLIIVGVAVALVAMSPSSHIMLQPLLAMVVIAISVVPPFFSLPCPEFHVVAAVSRDLQNLQATHTQTYIRERPTHMRLGCSGVLHLHLIAAQLLVHLAVHACKKSVLPRAVSAQKKGSYGDGAQAANIRRSQLE